MFWLPLLLNLYWVGALIGYMLIVVIMLISTPVLAVELPVASFVTSLLGDSELTPPKSELF